MYEDKNRDTIEIFQHSNLEKVRQNAMNRSTE